jgi:plastocyanin
VPIPDQSLVVDPQTRGVANVFIWLEDAPEGGKETKPDSPLVFDQQNCTFVPHALVVRAGQPIEVKSSDQVNHNIRTTPLKNKPVNETLAPLQSFQMVYEDQEKVPVTVKCDIHTWMNAYQLPVEHPYAAVTNEKGEFTIPDLPAGEYEFLVWHEGKGFLERGYAVTIQPGDGNNVTIEYGLNRLAGVAAPSVNAVAATSP